MRGYKKKLLSLINYWPFSFSMKQHFIIYLFGLLLLTSCQREIEPTTIVGYIAQGSTPEFIVIEHPDSLAPTYIAISENTSFSGGSPIIGNIAEVVYLPSESDEVANIAVSIAADKTFPQALGRWMSRDDRRLKVAIELQPDGKIVQSEPSDILRYTSWHLTGEDDIIELCGTLSLPPEPPKKDKKTKKVAETDTILPPARRIRAFRVKAEIGFDNNNKVMVITSPKGRKSKLYWVE